MNYQKMLVVETKLRNDINSAINALHQAKIREREADVIARLQKTVDTLKAEWEKKAKEMEGIY